MLLLGRLQGSHSEVGTGDVVGIPECSNAVVNTKLDKMSYCFACKRISKFQPTKDNVC